MDFIVIDQNPDTLKDTEALKYLYLNMDATSEDALLKAGIMKAKGLVTAVSSDADNVFITLTAKGLRPDIFILARASEGKNEDKLLRSGATRVVTPYHIGGRRMAQVLKRPTVVDFLDIATMSNKLGLMMEEATINSHSHLVGKNLIESYLRRDFGVIIIGIKKPSGEMIFNPMPSEKLEAGDVLVVIGKKEDLLRMNEVI
jgi:voltage-gated potassium channel